MANQFRQGLLYGLAAYVMWGAIPIYFRWLGNFANSYDILTHRIVWSALLLLIVLLVLRGNGQRLKQALSRRGTAFALLVSSILIALNWFVYIYGVETRRLTHCSLGYFVTPLLNVALGVFLLGEKFRMMQGVAMACGAVGLVIMASMTEGFPWIAITLAATFSSYGLMRKLAPIDTLTALTAESLILAPAALGYLLTKGSAWQNADGLGQWMLTFTGPATVIPLFCFGQAARKLPLSTLGFLQYLSPSLQFLVAVILFQESFNVVTAIAFGIVWLGLVIFTMDIVQRQKRAEKGDVVQSRRQSA